MQVYYIGAGPGSPDLITMRGHRIIAEADVIIYAGSLVNPEVIAHRKETAQVYNSAHMNLGEIVSTIKEAVNDGKTVARVHTGDPSIYGSIREQMEMLEREGIKGEVVPGVSSFVASAAALGKEFTVPEITQTVICTRMEGRTPVPELEQIERLASHQASMAIFLSVHMMDELSERLAQHYPWDTPVAVVMKATWPDQKIIRGTLETIAQQVKDAEIKKTAMILVGRFLGDEFHFSKLYDAGFSHEYRSKL